MERRRDPHQTSRYGFIYNELADEECIECGKQAAVVYEDSDGLTHYCDECDPTRGDLCEACRGTGVWAEPYSRCSSCQGQGTLVVAATSREV